MSTRGMLDALERVAEIAEWGFSAIDASSVPPRRLVEVARWGKGVKASRLRRNPPARRIATLVATMLCLDARAIDEALDLFDALMVTDVLAKAERETAAVRARNYPVLSRDGMRCAAAVTRMLHCEPSDTMTVVELWEQIEAVVSRADLARAVERLTELVPALDSAPDLEARRELVARAPRVLRFVSALVATIEFDATSGPMAVLTAFRELPTALAAASSARGPAEFISKDQIRRGVVPAGAWQQLVFPPGRPRGTVRRHAYVMCVVEQFHQRLRRRDIHATPSSRWADPRARLLSGDVWDEQCGPILNALNLPSGSSALLSRHSTQLDTAWRATAASTGDDAAFSIDDDGRVHASRLDALEDSPSLIASRRQCETMLPRVDIGELILEVMSWHPEFVHAFTRSSTVSHTCVICRPRSPPRSLRRR